MKGTNDGLFVDIKGTLAGHILSCEDFPLLLNYRKHNYRPDYYYMVRFLLEEGHYEKICSLSRTTPL